MINKLKKAFIILLILQFTLGYGVLEAQAYGNKVSEKSVKVTPEVTHTYTKYLSGSTPAVVNMLDINLNDPFTKVEIGFPNPLNSLKTTTLLAKENSYAGHKVVGAVNASFFLGNGMPANLLAKDNKIVNYGILGEKFESPTQKPVAFGVTKNGTATADYYNTDLSFTVNGKKYSIDLINNERTADKNVLYTASERTTGTNEWGTELVISQSTSNTKELHFGDRFKGTISAITRKGTGGNAIVPSDGFVISVQNTDLGNELSSLPIGTEVEVSLAIDDKWKDAQFILAGGPLLVKDGNVHISMPTSSSFVKTRRARTAVAVDSTGKRVFMVTVDQSDASKGTSLTSLASYLVSIGAKYAINLDGGGSTTMSVLPAGGSYPVRVNVPSDPGNTERRVSAILQVVNTSVYSDVSSRHWAVNEILDLYNRSLVKGYPNGSFKPDNTITRAETATIIARALNLQATTGASFPDVKSSHYAYQDISAASEKGIFIGREKGQFIPEGKLTRAEMATVLTRAYQLSGSGHIPFSDVKASNWAYNEIQILVASNLLKGYPDNTFKPNRQITRAEFVTLLSRVLNNN